MSKVRDHKLTVLRDKKTVITRAAFWKVPHHSRPDEVHLKVGRYKKPEGIFDLEAVESLEPKSELTLDGEEFQSLVVFIQENYEPFKHGAKAFIPLDNPYDISIAQQLKQLLGESEKSEMLNFLLENNVVPEELEVGLSHARRLRAIGEFNALLESDHTENKWQEWFENNSWVLGSNFVKVLDERNIDTRNISDFLMQSYDGFLDIVEIKRPKGGLQFWHSSLDHGNYIPHSDLIKAITQAAKYIHEVEREADSIKFFERVGGIKTIKPRCTLIYGR
ncbi:Shedu anti-phage system protein SduA domain-containing protein [Billgrantia endophytica]|uniref:Shedu anti-phage system protein SduA domain-containing protein n=1 Tax=Billgrantia endophytica TaxID=2033802 RepID=UPI00197ABC86|nr:Shedu anti-phage system protein SduA domain-containing protein [Halomonas endophytica]